MGDITENMTMKQHFGIYNGYATHVQYIPGNLHTHRTLLQFVIIMYQLIYPWVIQKIAHC